MPACAGMTGSKDDMRTILHYVEKNLRDAGIGDERREARFLVMAALGVESDGLSRAEPLSSSELERIEHFLARRCRNEPLARIEGVQEFYGRMFAMNEATLEPRADSAPLVDVVLEHYKEGGRFLDIGTGTGCLLLTLLAEREKATGAGTDISERALEAARANAQSLGLAERVVFQKTSWAENIEGPFDAILSNPPYIPRGDIPALQPEVNLYDPLVALDGGDDGLTGHRAVIPQAYTLLKPGGLLAVEGGYDQAPAIMKLFAAAGFRDVQTRKDGGGIERVTLGFKQALFAER
jgi:release factor glutamine methyltransferase